MFKPYAGVSTAVLLFTRGAQTDRIWFYDMAHDGFSLDDKRQRTAENDLPDILECWRHRHDPAFEAERTAHLEALRSEAAPLKAERLRLHRDINRLTFESAIAPDDERPDRSSSETINHRADDGETDVGRPVRSALDGAKASLAALEARLAPLQSQIDRLSRPFWVSKAQVKGNKYDLSASRYRQVEQDEAYYEEPRVTLERLLELETIMKATIEDIQGMME